MKVKPPQALKRKRTLFTLVELLVVMTIIGMLSGLLLPALSSGLEEGRGALCLNQSRQLGTATQIYVQEYNGSLFPCLPGHPQDHWANLLYVDYLEQNDGVFLCPEVEAEDAFNPHGGQGDYGNMRNCAYIMNTIQRAEWAGYQGAYGTAKFGYTREDGTDPVRLDRTRSAQAILLTDILAPMPQSATGKMIKRFNETDHGVEDGMDQDGITDSEERKVGHAHDERFNALFGDGHAQLLWESSHDQWVAVFLSN